MKIIGIHGRARSGKDTLASFLVDHHGFHRIGLADPLRRFVGDITGLSEEQLMDGAVKEEPIPWLNDKSPRYLMQTLGTEWGRALVSDGVWLAVAHAKIEAARKAGFAGVVIPDIRFDNEAEWVNEMGGEVVHLVRPGAVQVNAHASENGIADHLVEYLIVNNGTLGDLAKDAEFLAV